MDKTDDASRAADHALIASIADEAKTLGASRVASLFGSERGRLLAIMAEARQMASQKRKASPFVYIMQ